MFFGGLVTFLFLSRRRVGPLVPGMRYAALRASRQIARFGALAKLARREQCSRNRRAQTAARLHPRIKQSDGAREIPFTRGPTRPLTSGKAGTGQAISTGWAVDSE